VIKRVLNRIQKKEGRAFFKKYMRVSGETILKKKKESQVLVAKYFPGKDVPIAPPGFTNVLIHTSPNTLGGPLSPYLLKDEDGCILENKWQFSKFYGHVSKQRILLGKYHKDTIVWEHPEEEHSKDENGVLTPNDAYWTWRQKGMRNQYAVRYPNGFEGRRKCICSIHIVGDQTFRLSYIEARKQIYCAEYVRLAPRTDAFKQLKSLLNQGSSLQIIEVDGPDPSLTFPPYDQISKEKPGLLITEETIRMLVNDERKPFGHGYVIAALLLGGEEWMK
jgi:hypothetical protein